MKKITESDSLYNDLENMSVSELLSNINAEDKKVAKSVESQISKIEKLIKLIVSKINIGGLSWKYIIYTLRQILGQSLKFYWKAR